MTEGYERPRFLTLALVAICAIVLLNSFLFVVRTADPLLVQDGWYYLDVFLSKAIHGDLRVADFFTRRSGLDHSQPFYKLIYLIELKYFDLDFLPQAVAGLVAACGIAVISLLAMGRDYAHGKGDFKRQIGFISILVCVLSLNGTEIWTWPDVAMQYLCFFFVALFFYVVNSACCTRDFYKVTLVTFVLTFVASDVAAIAITASVIVHACEFRKHSRFKLRRIAVAVVSFAVAKLIFAFLTPVVGGVDEGQSLSAVASAWRDSWKWIVLPLANSLVAKENLVNYFQANAELAQIVLAILIGFLHIVFWISYFRYSVKSFAQSFAACLMLLFYGLVAGIIIGRIGIFGSDYLDSPRYVLYYQFNLVALLVMWVASKKNHPVLGWWSDGAGALLITGFLMLQMPLSRMAWGSAPYHRIGYYHIAEQIDQIERDPSETPKNCASELPLCRMTAEQRERAVGLLRTAKLNIYSPTFRAMHGFIGLGHEGG